ncbi:hypothetical protein [Ferroacidibacillus organovorans]|uniref:Uncharacterized protein n=1 Tax=Ferroacidibacillus organovorans TaxID=1765683 RepID=A0A162TFR0_9BACL|nr:hypothetical protein [Ferroacidibacillus organovorans]KYP80759.1 hypothetical protein AYJ22_09785 [Ferroacidibacillus organovorans]OAG93541.1 hypothetical protein AYW79_09940 [Ferroacidibacillus organovorans]OPG16794.1 hypothetical protein B2M26_04650 [Ferroacidibacillus organovorans]
MNPTNDDPDSHPLLSRKEAHPKERITPLFILKWLVSPLQPAPRNKTQKNTRKTFATPRQKKKSSRSGARRRKRRLRIRRALRFKKYAVRTSATVTLILIIAIVSFWAKFAVVTQIPDVLRQGVLLHARAYIVLKSWWFGPPYFSLSTYLNESGGNSIANLEQQLGMYVEIIKNPNEILWVFQGG